MSSTFYYILYLLYDRATKTEEMLFHWWHFYELLWKVANVQSTLVFVAFDR